MCWHASCEILITAGYVCNQKFCQLTVAIPKEDAMKSSTKDQAEGAFHKVKGTIKEAAGIIIKNPNLEAEGSKEKIDGAVQKKIGQIKKVLEN
jgi:uncharacterized protein YjbJ (UPF0337 family)